MLASRLPPGRKDAEPQGPRCIAGARSAFLCRCAGSARQGRPATLCRRMPGLRLLRDRKKVKPGLSRAGPGAACDSDRFRLETRMTRMTRIRIESVMARHSLLPSGGVARGPSHPHAHHVSHRIPTPTSDPCPAPLRCPSPAPPWPPTPFSPPPPPGPSFSPASGPRSGSGTGPGPGAKRSGPSASRAPAERRPTMAGPAGPSRTHAGGHAAAVSGASPTPLHCSPPGPATCTVTVRVTAHTWLLATAAGYGCWLRLLATAAGYGCWLRLLATAAGYGCWLRRARSMQGTSTASTSCCCSDRSTPSTGLLHWHRAGWRFRVYGQVVKPRVWQSGQTTCGRAPLLL